MTVNKDRLINAQNEPQNWLMMNGDYGSTRYSKLTQINRDNVKSLHMVWALALGGMQDVGQNGPEAEVNPLIDNGFMYTSDGWGTIYKIDARNPNKGEFVWISDSGVRHEGNVPRSRGIAPAMSAAPTWYYIYYRVAPQRADEAAHAVRRLLAGRRDAPHRHDPGGQAVRLVHRRWPDACRSGLVLRRHRSQSGAEDRVCRFCTVRSVAPSDWSGR
jgi:hypothetical protein